MSQFSLSWNQFNSNICSGLSSLQQKEEFVDMTLAADGHFVKVHQIVMSLASPYLKELIQSAVCPHPVIFLNKISYQVLSYILEYVYTGEVRVRKEYLDQLIEAGKALHIKGLEDMSEAPAALSQNVKHTDESNACMTFKPRSTNLVDNLQKYKTQTSRDPSRDHQQQPQHIVTIRDGTSRDHRMEDDNMADPFTDLGGGTFHDDDDFEMKNGGDHKRESMGHDDSISLALSRSVKSSTVAETSESGSKTVQYTLSNQGSLQLVLNRFVYFLRYAHKNTSPPVRQWRCVDYIRNRCPASVTTKDDVVIQRIAAHKHPFHDKKIVKKMQAGAIFTAIKDAETQGQQLSKKNKEKESSPSDKE